MLFVDYVAKLCKCAQLFKESVFFHRRQHNTKHPMTGGDDQPAARLCLLWTTCVDDPARTCGNTEAPLNSLSNASHALTSDAANAFMRQGPPPPRAGGVQATAPEPPTVSSVDGWNATPSVPSPPTLLSRCPRRPRSQWCAWPPPLWSTGPGRSRILLSWSAPSRSSPLTTALRATLHMPSAACSSCSFFEGTTPFTRK